MDPGNWAVDFLVTWKKRNRNVAWPISWLRSDHLKKKKLGKVGKVDISSDGLANLAKVWNHGGRLKAVSWRWATLHIKICHNSSYQIIKPGNGQAPLKQHYTIVNA